MAGGVRRCSHDERDLEREMLEEDVVAWGRSHEGGFIGGHWVVALGPLRKWTSAKYMQFRCRMEESIELTRVDIQAVYCKVVPAYTSQLPRTRPKQQLRPIPEKPPAHT